MFPIYFGTCHMDKYTPSYTCSPLMEVNEQLPICFGKKWIGNVQNGQSEWRILIANPSVTVLHWFAVQHFIYGLCIIWEWWILKWNVIIIQKMISGLPMIPSHTMLLMYKLSACVYTARSRAQISMARFGILTETVISLCCINWLLIMKLIGLSAMKSKTSSNHGSVNSLFCNYVIKTIKTNKKCYHSPVWY